MGVIKETFTTAGNFHLEELVVDDMDIEVNCRNDDFAVGVNHTAIVADVETEVARLALLERLVFIGSFIIILMRVVRVDVTQSMDAVVPKRV